MFSVRCVLQGRVRSCRICFIIEDSGTGKERGTLGKEMDRLDSATIGHFLPPIIQHL